MQSMLIHAEYSVVIHYLGSVFLHFVTKSSSFSFFDKRE
jgi:hypothetical protein